MKTFAVNYIHTLPYRHAFESIDCYDKRWYKIYIEVREALPNPRNEIIDQINEDIE